MGAGYVGYSLAVMLATKNNVKILDIDDEKIAKINSNIPLIRENEIEKYLKDIHLVATKKSEEAYKEADIIFICVPTNFDEERLELDLSVIETVLTEIKKYGHKDNVVVIKSTLSIGATKRITNKFNLTNVVYMPEFLREGNSLKDQLNPSRIVIGYDLKSQQKDIKMLKVLFKNVVNVKYVKYFCCKTEEAEAIKLFSNTYLAMRVAFFNELDSFAENLNLDTKKIILGICADKRIGDFYNNPSFGFGGYCLPKDSKQLISNLKTPKELIKAIPTSNKRRKSYIVKQIIRKKPKCVGIFRLLMKSNSDDFRQSCVFDIIEQLIKSDIKVLVYEPLLGDDNSYNLTIVKNIDNFKTECDLIVANRITEELEDVLYKVYSRDVFRNN